MITSFRKPLFGTYYALGSIASTRRMMTKYSYYSSYLCGAYVQDRIHNHKTVPKPGAPFISFSMTFMISLAFLALLLVCVPEDS